MATDSSISIKRRPPKTDGPEPESDQEARLWNDFRNGDKSAYAYIYVRFFPILYNYGCRMCKDKGLVQDCIQDLFVELSNPQNKLSATTSIRFYLYRCIRRKISLKTSKLALHRTESLDTHVDDISDEVAILPIEFQQIELERAEEQKREVLKALEFLTKKQRKIIQLRFYEELSCKDISARMSVNINTVYNLLSIAKASLKTVIKRFPLLLLMLIKSPF